MDKKIYTILAIVIVLLLLGVIYFVTRNLGVGLPEGEVKNGWYNAATDECWIDKDTPPGVVPADKVDQFIVSCCFDNEGYQVDCNNASIRLGPRKSLAVYYTPTTPEGRPGIFSVMHNIATTNTGNIKIDEIWIDSVTWTPTSQVLDDAYSVVVGKAHKRTDIPIGAGASWSTGSIDLQAIGGEPGNPIQYNLELVIKATAGGGVLSGSKTTTGWIKVEKENLDFDINIGWGA